MNKKLSEEWVKNCVKQYLEDYKRSNARWSEYSTASGKSSDTGWDLSYVRKNKIIFIEAKSGKGAFDSKFSACVNAILFRRGKETQKYFKSKKYNQNNESETIKAAFFCMAFSSGRKEPISGDIDNYYYLRSFLYKIRTNELRNNFELLKNSNFGNVFFVDSNKKILNLNLSEIKKLSMMYEKLVKKEFGNIYEISNNNKKLQKIINRLCKRQKWK